MAKPSTTHRRKSSARRKPARRRQPRRPLAGAVRHVRRNGAAYTRLARHLLAEHPAALDAVLGAGLRAATVAFPAYTVPLMVTATTVKVMIRSAR